MLADTLRSILEASKPGCRVGRWLQAQDDEVQELFEQLFAKEGLNITDLFNALVAEANVPFKKTLFTDHMRGKCSCPQP